MLHAAAARCRPIFHLCRRAVLVGLFLLETELRIKGANHQTRPGHIPLWNADFISSRRGGKGGARPQVLTPPHLSVDPDASPRRNNCSDEATLLLAKMHHVVNYPTRR